MVIMALDTSHKYHEMLMQLGSFQGTVHNGRIPLDFYMYDQTLLWGL